ncbi:MAG: deoxyribodipyrimidine photo-lyase [Casimicrobiaceae bacterium]
MHEFERALCWLRRDLRDFDNAALAGALEHAQRVWCAFVFDRAILDALTDRHDRRVEFILESVKELRDALRRRGGGLIVRHGNARIVVAQLAQQLDVGAVFVNRDYEPGAKIRDAAVAGLLRKSGIEFIEHKDQVIFERNEVLTRAGRPFSVYSPYRNAWLAALQPADLRPRVPATGSSLESDPDDQAMPSLESLGFRPTHLAAIPVSTGMSGGRKTFKAFLQHIDRYGKTRDFPAVQGTSNLSVHLRFGTTSIRTLAAEAHARMLRGGAEDGAGVWLSELIWRDFYFMVLDHNPQVVEHAFKPEFDRIEWPNDRALFAAWCEGRTGYPLVDAAMRQLNSTGWMHNRLRMVTASFLVKDLHVDWRWGERYFAAKLIDYDLAANNGGWQWAASTGCDAQPYFRIFNPVTQSERFDPAGEFIRKFVPELRGVPAAQIHAPWKMPPLLQQASGVVIGRDYPEPIVDHAVARNITLALYALKGAGKT